MCKPASFVLTKTKVFWSLESDSHEDIINEHGLSENGVRGVKILRVEIAPDNGDLSRPLKEWDFGYDQDMLPNWADKKTDEKRVRAELKLWAKAKLFTNGEHVVRKGFAYACGSSTVTACDSSTVRAYDSSTVRAYDSSTVTACGSSTVTACDSSTVRAYDSSTVTAYDSSTVTACGSSTVTACDSSTVTAYGSSTVRACENHSTARIYGGAKPCVPKGPNAVVIDCRKERAKCKVGK